MDLRWLCLLLLGCFAPARIDAGTCVDDLVSGSGMNYLPCGDFAKADNHECSQRTWRGVQCCSALDDSGRVSCWVRILDIEKNIQNTPNGDFNTWAEGVQLPKAANEGEFVVKAIKISADIRSNDEVGEISESTIKTVQNRAKNALTQGVKVGMSPSKTSPFPRCPVSIKMCHRTPCHGRLDSAREADPTLCLSDPTCCYDYRLRFMRSFAGKYYMEGTPLCYNGATSNQWLFVTDIFEKLDGGWNAWLTGAVLETFEGFFDTDHYIIGGRVACMFTLSRKAYPVGSKTKLQCSLVGGCWDDSLPAASRCYMPSESIQRRFGQAEVYPSLYSSDPQESSCSAHPYDYGATSFSRLPCYAGPEPSALLSAYQGCDKDCCFSYAANNPLSVARCPFNKLVKSQYLPDLSSDVDGCCVIPSCYHKKENKYPHKPPPAIANWSSWSECSASCGQVGSKGRQCLTAGQSTPGSCLGSSTEVCYGKACTTPSWGPWSSCDATCGESGYRYRQCSKLGQCVGRSAETCYGNQCSDTYSWGKFALHRPCSVSCGVGTEIWKKTCMRNSQSVMPDRFCVGLPEKEHRSCQRTQCPLQDTASWGSWIAIAPCSVSCGAKGLRKHRRQCMRQGGVALNAYCDGTWERLVPCTAPPCSYFWVPDVEPCKLDPNSGRYCVSQKTRSVTLDCYAKRGPGDFVKVQRFHCGSMPISNDVPCVEQECRNEPMTG